MSCNNACRKVVMTLRNIKQWLVIAVAATVTVGLAVLAYYLWPIPKADEYLATLRLPDGYPTAVVFLDDPSTICIGTSRGQVFGWECNLFAPGKVKARFVIEEQTEGLISTLFDSGNGMLLGGDSQGQFLGWAAPDHKGPPRPQQLNGFPAPITAIAVRYAAKAEAIIGLASGYLCFLTPGEKPKVLPVHKGAVKQIAVHPTLPLLVTADAAGRILWWDMEHFKVKQISEEHRTEVQSLSFSHDGKQLASGDWNGELLIWNVEQRKEIKRFSQPDAVAGLCWIGNDLLTGSWDGYVRRWSVTDEKIIKEVHAHCAIQDLVLAPDEKLLAVVPAMNNVQLWRVPK